MSSSSSDYSLLLWSLSGLVYWLGAHVTLGALREARRDVGLRANLFLLLTAGLAVGSAVCAGIVLSLTSTTMGFAVGFKTLAAVGLIAGAWAAGLLAAAWLSLKPGWVSAIGGAVLIGAMTTGVQLGWVLAAGFRPGFALRPDAIGSALAITIVGSLIALRLAFTEAALFSRTRQRWRLVASGLLAAAFFGSQELVEASARLASQVGSVFQSQLPAPVLSLVFGVVVPLLLIVAALDLGSGRRRRRDDAASSLQYPPGSSTSHSGGRRRRRRHRIRSL
jgi:hypothetical protein